MRRTCLLSHVLGDPYGGCEEGDTVVVHSSQLDSWYVDAELFFCAGLPTSILVFFGNLVGSLFFAAILVKCKYCLSLLVPTQPFLDSGILSAAPFPDYVTSFAVYAFLSKLFLFSRVIVL